jgi:hypothetical protein
MARAVHTASRSERNAMLNHPATAALMLIVATLLAV